MKDWQVFQRGSQKPKVCGASVCCLSVVKLLVCIVCIDNIIINISMFAFSVLSSSCMFLDNISYFLLQGGWEGFECEGVRGCSCRLAWGGRSALLPWEVNCWGAMGL